LLGSYPADKHTDKLTNNKQTPLKTSTALRYATPVDKRYLDKLNFTV